MEALKVVILGIIQGITEWLPVSSTGHMLLFDEVMPLAQDPEFVSVYNVLNERLTLFEGLDGIV